MLPLWRGNCAAIWMRSPSKLWKRTAPGGTRHHPSWRPTSEDTCGMSRSWLVRRAPDIAERDLDSRRQRAPGSANPTAAEAIGVAPLLLAVEAAKRLVYSPATSPDNPSAAHPSSGRESPHHSGESRNYVPQNRLKTIAKRGPSPDPTKTACYSYVGAKRYPHRPK